MSVRLDPNTGEPLPSEQQEFSHPLVSIPEDKRTYAGTVAETGGPFYAGNTATSDPREHILQFFDKSVRYVGVPDAQPVLDWVNEVAHRVVEMIPRNPERTVALRKLVEAKDCIIRAALAK